MMLAPLKVGRRRFGQFSQFTRHLSQLRGIYFNRVTEFSQLAGVPSLLSERERDEDDYGDYRYCGVVPY